MLGTILIAVAVMAALGVAGFYGAQFAFKKDTEIEARRRAAGKLAIELAKVGLVKTPEFLIDYSVGDYSAMLYKMKHVAEMATGDPKAFMAEFDKVFDNLLTAKMATEDGRTLLAAKLQSFAQKSDPIVAPAVVAAPAKV